MFPAAHLPLSGFSSHDTTNRFLGPPAVRRAAIRIPFYCSAGQGQKLCPTFFSRAENKKACCLRTANSPHCLGNVIFGTNSTPFLAAITGTSGTHGCPNCFVS